MKIFVGFGYNDQDKWIKQDIIPLLESFGFEVVTGEDMHGKTLSETVKKRIKDSDYLLGFLTKRDELSKGKFTSHQWVHDELNTAYSYDIPAIPILEEDVSLDNIGAIYDRQRIVFSIKNKIALIIELVKAINDLRKDWEEKQRKKLTKRVLLLPKGLLGQITPYLETSKISCTYQFLHGKNQFSEIYEGKVFDTHEEELFILIQNIPNDATAMVRVTIMAPQIYWTSGFAPCDAFPLTLRV